MRGRPVAPPAHGPDGLMPMTPYVFDTEIQIEALVGLLDAHSDRVIPLLREIEQEAEGQSLPVPEADATQPIIP